MYSGLTANEWLIGACVSAVLVCVLSVVAGLAVDKMITAMEKNDD